MRAEPTNAAPDALYGVTDDGWLLDGAGTLDSRLAALDTLGVDVVRFTVRWDDVAETRPENARDEGDPAYDWRRIDRVLKGLRRHRIAALVTLDGTPSWANGGRSPNWAPTSERAFASFAFAAATRYPWVRFWSIWNEPNRPLWLRPTSPGVYVQKLLNPAYAEIHAAIPQAQVAGGETGPRAGAGGVNPVAWIRGMDAAHARLDAYAHHPYPNNPKAESPWGPKCSGCSTIAMADLERLETDVRHAFGEKPIWLTEYGYQTDPPDPYLGVSLRTQAHYVASSARRAYLAPDVTMLILFVVRDDTSDAGWQSGLYKAAGKEKPSYTAFRFPLTQASRRGTLVGLWGEIRPRTGTQPYRIRRYENRRWSWVTGVRQTDARGAFTLEVRARRGSLLETWSPRDRAYSLPVRVR